MAVPPFTTPPTWVVNQIVASADLNTYIRDNTSFLYNPPGCMAYRPSDQAIADSTWTSEGMSNVVWDSDGISSNSQPATFTIQTQGMYRVSATAQFQPNAAGRRMMRINVNTGTLIASAEQPSPATTFAADMNCGNIWQFDVGDSIQVEVWQNSGSGLNLQGSNAPEGYSIAINWVGFA